MEKTNQPDSANVGILARLELPPQGNTPMNTRPPGGMNAKLARAIASASPITNAPLGLYQFRAWGGRNRKLMGVGNN